MATANLRMRKIAQTEIQNIFPGLAPAVLEEYTTSVVRQWITNRGHAGLFSVTVNYWLRWIDKGDRFEVALGVCPSNTTSILSQWKATPDMVPEIVHVLSLAQSVTFVNTSGATIRVTVEPIERAFRFGEVADDDDLV